MLLNSTPKNAKRRGNVKVAKCFLGVLLTKVAHEKKTSCHRSLWRVFCAR